MTTALTSPTLADRSEALVSGEAEARIQAQVRAAPSDLWPGEVVCLRLANSVTSLLDLLTAWRLDLVPLIAPPSAEEAHVIDLLRRADARLMLDVGRFQTSRPAPGPTREAGAILLTSGSTGARKLCHRSFDSLIAEGERYRAFWGDAGWGELGLIAPLHHAYAFGALMGGLVSSTALRLVEATRLDEAADAVAECRVSVLTPMIARLAAQRLRSAPARGISHDRLVIAGAGPVDETLDALFLEAFGVRLARNYGSTETGAVLAAHPGLVACATGFPMRGISCRIDGDEDGGGRLLVRVDGMAGTDWYDMGDLARGCSNGAISVLGRADDAIRRGERFVPHLEVERAAVSERGIRAARSRRDAALAANDRYILDVWPYDPSSFDPAAFRRALGRQVANEDLPDLFVRRIVPARMASGKLAALPSYRLGAPAAIEDAARAYKRAKLLFALHELGVLARLAEGDVDAVARACGLDPGMLEFALRLAELYGLVVSATDERRAEDSVLEVVALEALLEGTANSVDALKATLRTGVAPKTFEKSAFLKRYGPVMAGRMARVRAQWVLRSLRPGTPPATVVEAGYGPPVYLGCLPPGWGRESRCFLSGSDEGVDWAGEEVVAVASPADLPVRVGLAVLANAVHWPGAVDKLTELWARLEPEGILVVDDLFLSEGAGSADIAIDWMTHGGLSCVDATGVHDFLVDIGADVRTMGSFNMGHPLQGAAAWRVFVAGKRGGHAEC
jgi:hypothetical protein